MSDNFYDRMEDMARRHATCPTCTDQRRQLAQLTLLLAVCALGIGAVIGWALHAWINGGHC